MRIFCSVFLALALAVSPVQVSRAEQYDEYAIKAALLYKFTKFVEWPISSFTAGKHHFRICVYGDDPYGPRLDELEEKDSGDVSVYRHDMLRESVLACQIIFISETSSDRLLESIAYFDNAPILTVGEAPDFVLQGGMIGLVRDNDRIRFEINQIAADHAGLNVSAQLLRIAQRVIRE